MKLRQFIFIILLSLVGLQFVVGQEKPKAILVDEDGNRCDESIMARVANFKVGVSNEPKSRGLILFYGSENDEGNNLSLIEWFKFYSKMYGFEVSVIRGANQKNPKVEFWVVPESAELPKPKAKFLPPVFDKKVRFDFAYAFVEFKVGELQSNHLETGCQLQPNLSEFSKILLANKNLQGLVIVDNQSKYEGFKVAKIILKKLTKNYKLTQNRFHLNFRYKDELGKAELWLVPKNK